MQHNGTMFDEQIQQIYEHFVNFLMPEFAKDYEYKPWVFSLLGSMVIGLAGILPLIIIPSDDQLQKDGYAEPGESKFLKVLLSFAVGGLLGDVFLHLLPEAWGTVDSGDSDGSNEHPPLRSGLWVLAGILIFTIVEKVFSGYTSVDDENPMPKCVEIANCLLRRTGGKFIEGQSSQSCTGGSCDIEDVPNGCFLHQREHGGHSHNNNDEHKHHTKKVAGYLNLIANSIDNFTHGLAVAGSFLVSFRHGVLATFAILLHEIPHEVGDFAILLRSGFNRWDAAKAQLLTAGAGLLGALVAIGGSGVTSAMEARSSWIMPFTAGGFLHIALVTVLPDLLKEEDRLESFKQIVALIVGIALMGVMTVLFES